ncbi:MAG: (4Fe-4S)-binding protein [Alphaproteobacteria bacterium CG_4_10_14_0_2_um_filter_63_37]|nr:MAG: hypothetical protein AUJ55_02545 [Proteobacteria bacterium CG1_02_64_396]PJA24575.1 MAG: (4Fe-4S)-binding protein [Alphaproteobacteria bacterium CG_4_10_14_0_2_um_filter_63_37]
MLERKLGLHGVTPSQGVAGRRRYAMVVDLRACTGCAACVVSCKTSFDVPLGEWRMWIKEEEAGEFPHVQHLNLPRFCNHCDSPPCVRNCPTGATFKHPDGQVLQRYNRCIGCRTCMATCPYNARHFLPEHRADSRTPINVVDKCDGCITQVSRGELPVCVATCPHGALSYGDLNDRESAVARLVAVNRVSNLRPDMGTNPMVFYIGLDQGLSDPADSYLDRSAQLAERKRDYLRHHQELEGDYIEGETGPIDFIGRTLTNLGRFLRDVPSKLFGGGR